MLFHWPPILPVERIREPAGAVDRRLDAVRELLPAGRVGAAQASELRRRARRPASPRPAARSRAARTGPRSRENARSPLTGRHGSPPQTSTGWCADQLGDVARGGRARRRSRPARARAPRRGSSTSTWAIASLPAGTSGSSSSTASSGSTSSSTSRAREQEDLRVEPLERQLELLLVAHVDDRLEVGVRAGSSSGRMSDRVGVARRSARRARAAAGSSRSRMPSIADGDRQRLRRPGLGVSRAARVVDADDDRDPISLGDALAETSRDRALLRQA